MNNNNKHVWEYKIAQLIELMRLNREIQVHGLGKEENRRRIKRFEPSKIEIFIDYSIYSLMSVTKTVRRNQK